MTDTTESHSVRQARYNLATALLTDPSSVTEAVEHLDRAASEPGADPPTWLLQRSAGDALRDSDPTGAVDRYLRSVKNGAPREVAMEARRWVSSLPAGNMLKAGSDPLEYLQKSLERPTDEAAEAHFFCATLLRARGDVARALEVAQHIGDVTDAISSSELRLFKITCLIDLKDFLGAREILERDPQLLGPEIDLIRARLAFASGDFETVLEKTSGSQVDELQAFRNLSLVALGRSVDVLNWDMDDPSLADGPDTWLSRAVAALAARQYGEAQNAASRVARSHPTNLSTQLVQAQARLENDDLEAGLAALESVARVARDRGRDPAWLDRQRLVRSDGRFRYVECEYLRLREGRISQSQLDAVPTSDTTYAQDGRLAILAAEIAPSEAQAADALDRAVSAYWSANAYDTAVRVALRAFETAPTCMRAVNLGWSAYNLTFVQASPTVGEVQEYLDTLAIALDAIAETLDSANHAEVLECIKLLGPLYARRAELLNLNKVQAGLEALPWVLAYATIATDRAEAQLILDWVMRQTLDVAAGSMEIIEYAAGLDQSLSTEARLIARTNWIGADEECHRLLNAVMRERRETGNQPTVDEINWERAMTLRLAVLDGDEVEIDHLIYSDLGEYEWALHMQALVLMSTHRSDSALAIVKRLQAQAASSNTGKVVAAWIATMLNEDGVKVEELLGAALADGNTPVGVVEDDRSLLAFARSPDRPLVEFAKDRLSIISSPAEIRFFERATLPWLETRLGRLTEDEWAEVKAMAEQHAKQLLRRWHDWPGKLSTQELIQALIALWRSVAQENVAATLRAAVRLTDLPIAESATGILVSHLVEEIRGRANDWALKGAITAIAAGNPVPTDIIPSPIGDRSTAADLVGALSGRQVVRDAVSEHRAVLIDALQRANISGLGLWRVYDAISAGESPAVHELTVAILDHLSAASGLMTPGEVQWRSQLGFILGAGFVPVDTGPQWKLFSEYIPALRARIEAETKFRMPGFNVRGARPHMPENVVQLMLHGAVRETLFLPTSGVITLGPETEATLSDPLTGMPVVHVPPNETMSADPLQTWEPLEFVMRHVESFVRLNLAEVVTIWDAAQAAQESGADVTTDAASFVKWLGTFRRTLTSAVGAPSLASLT